MLSLLVANLQSQRGEISAPARRKGTGDRARRRVRAHQFVLNSVPWICADRVRRPHSVCTIVELYHRDPLQPSIRSPQIQTVLGTDWDWLCHVADGAAAVDLL